MSKREKPNLPEEGFEFCPATREWFEAWRSSRATDDWDDRQWQYMFDTAIVHSLELRTRLTQMGLYFEQD